MQRPIFVLKEFILGKDLVTVEVNSWQYHQYMAYLARILEVGSFSLLLELEMVEVFTCLSHAIVAAVYAGPCRRCRCGSGQGAVSEKESC